LNKGEITDARDGKKYKTIGIKTQMWMAENMDIDYKVKPLDSDSVAYGSYTNSSCDTCGHYYTWAAAIDSAGVFSTNALGCSYGSTCSAEPPVRGICPEGWHLPSMDEWETLIDDVGGMIDAGMVLCSRLGWGAYVAGSDIHGFSALPAGMRFIDRNSFPQEDDDDEVFVFVGEAALFWGMTESGAAGSEYFYPDFVSQTNIDEKYALSVRCLKDAD